MTAHLQLVSPGNENRTVRNRRQPPKRASNREIRQREYLNPLRGRNAHQDRAQGPPRPSRRDLDPHRLPHGLRGNRTLRLGMFASGVQPIGVTARPARQERGGRASTRSAATRSRRYASSNGNSRTRATSLRPSAAVHSRPTPPNRLIKRTGERAGFDFPVHCHMLLHGCGHALTNAGHDTRAIQDWLRHRSIQHTVRYTGRSPMRFKGFWR
jgi:hypothetical protein